MTNQGPRTGPSRTGSGTDGGSSRTSLRTDGGPSEETVVDAAADAAEDVIFSQYKQSAIRDYDVTVVFEDGRLEVDVYLNVPTDADDPDPERVADDAALAARAAVDDLFGA